MNQMTQEPNCFNKESRLQNGTKFLSKLNFKPSTTKGYSTPAQNVSLFQGPAYASQPPMMNYNYPTPMVMPQISLETMQQIQFLQALMTNNQSQAQMIPVMPYLIPVSIPIDSQASYDDQQKLLTQLTYQSRNNNTILSFQMDEKATKTSDSFYPVVIPNKPCTTQGFFHDSSINTKSFLNTKTVRNTIIIDEEEDAVETSTPKSKSPKMKHNSAPIKHESKKVFQTHLSKLPLEQNPADHIFHCGHDGCELTYRTKKQKVSHHGKMDPECQKDSTAILEMIAKMKKIIKQLTLKKALGNENVQPLIEKYENIMKQISIREYVQMICGLKYDDHSTMKDF